MYQANAKFTNEFGENAVFIAAEKGYEETYNIFNSMKQILWTVQPEVTKWSAVLLQ